MSILHWILVTTAATCRRKLKFRGGFKQLGSSLNFLSFIGRAAGPGDCRQQHARTSAPSTPSPRCAPYGSPFHPDTRGQKSALRGAGRFDCLREESNESAS